MMWTLQSFLGTFIDATVGQMVHALGTSGTSRPLPFWEPASPRRRLRTGTPGIFRTIP